MVFRVTTGGCLVISGAVLTWLAIQRLLVLFQWAPFVSLEGNASHGFTYDGLCIQILRELANNLNFTSASNLKCFSRYTCRHILIVHVHLHKIVACVFALFYALTRNQSVLTDNLHSGLYCFVAYCRTKKTFHVCAHAASAHMLLGVY